jgi:CheY-like chemotaxis protein
MGSVMSYRILVADDQADCRDAIQALLDRQGWATTTVCDGASALERLLDETFDLSLLDVHMPSLTGLEVLAQLRSFNRIVPSIIMTGNPSASIETEALDLGAITMLHKPVSADILRITIDRFFSQRG